MAWKEDTFFETHAQNYPVSSWGEKVPRPREGLRVRPQRNASTNSSPPWTAYLLSISFLLSYFFPRPESITWKLPVLLCFFAAFVAIHLLAGLVSARTSRYYVFDAVTGRFVSRRPMRRFELLTRVASDPMLLEHLGESRWGRRCRGVAWWIPCGRVMIGINTIILCVILALPLYFRVSLIWWGTVVLIAAGVALMVVVYRRTAPSHPRNDNVDWGLPPEDHALDGIGPVRNATLHWDRLLQREYFLLEHGGGQMRYYNFSGDPLYLLRLWKQRMPDAKLTIGCSGT